MGLLNIFLKPGHPIAMWLNHRHLYLLGLATILCGLGWSNILMSIGQFIIIGNWIIEFDFKLKLAKLKTTPLIWIVLGLFLIHIAGLLWTTDFKYASKDITTKLPLLAFPIIIGTTKKLRIVEWKLLLGVYVTTLFILTIASLGKYFDLWGAEVHDKRELSIYISHIRYGLNLAFASILLLWYNPLPERVLNVLLAIWFALSIVLFQLFTGLIILAAIIFTLSIIKRKAIFKSSRFIGLYLTFCILITAFLSYQVMAVYKSFNSTITLNYDQEDMSRLKTLNGEFYRHEGSDKRLENGVYTRRYIARIEIKKEWEKASSLPFKNEKGVDNIIAQRLYRYMSSKGLKKDSAGFATLSKDEIAAIENGTANHYYFTHNSLQNRMHKIFYEIREFRRTGNASGYSIAMRLVYWETGLSIFYKNLAFGVGTGDIKGAYKEEYELSDSKLDPIYRNRAHNQYITFLACFGIIGFLIIHLSIYYPMFRLRSNPILGMTFMLLISLSFLTEDTLETQAGVTLYAFFYCVILFGLNDFRGKISK
ncbi:O-antigen ligase family protein [Vicingaceae bacterium]|nr:O-antigen ligase family protein [Vicingaceae bacterium]MDB4060856.1 O-antigen ligase family protein [Vicingaceae bacterium]MDC1450797.1 O-antigen ligase family protein [Vicingaceae bacterium]